MWLIVILKSYIFSTMSKCWDALFVNFSLSRVTTLIKRVILSLKLIIIVNLDPCYFLLYLKIEILCNMLLLISIHMSVSNSPVKQMRRCLFFLCALKYWLVLGCCLKIRALPWISVSGMLWILLQIILVTMVGMRLIGNLVMRDY